jgi:hypothetical protein
LSGSNGHHAEAEWYATTTQGGVPEQEDEKRQDPDRH